MTTPTAAHIAGPAEQIPRFQFGDRVTWLNQDTTHQGEVIGFIRRPGGQLPAWYVVVHLANDTEETIFEEDLTPC